MTIPVTALGFASTGLNFGTPYLDLTPQQQVTEDVAGEESAPLNAQGIPQITINIPGQTGNPSGTLNATLTNTGTISGINSSNSLNTNSNCSWYDLSCIFAQFFNWIETGISRVALIFLAIVIIAIALELFGKGSTQKVEFVKQ